MLSCQSCGACCFNPPENREEGTTEYVTIEARDSIRRRPELLRRYAQERDGELHLKVLPDHRCAALLGSLGKRVRCAIYAQRPSPCRRVEAGSDLCHRYRREQGLE